MNEKRNLTAEEGKSSITTATGKFNTTTNTEKLSPTSVDTMSSTTKVDGFSINTSTNDVGKVTTSNKIRSTTNNNNPNTQTITARLHLARDFDDILEVVGSFGRYQKMMMCLIIMPVSFLASFTSNLFLFQMVEPDHWCYTPGRENTSYNVTEWRRLTRPSDAEELSKCLMHEINWISYNNTTTFAVTNKTRECSNGWEFDTKQFSTTVAMTLGWVCERADYSHKTLSISMAGNALGTLVLPILADKYVGRRVMFYVALALHIVFTIPLLWMMSTTAHMVLRFLQGLSFETNYLMPYIIFMELISAEHRALAVMMSFIAWTFGMCSTALVAWLLPNWQYLSIISLIPSLLGFLYWRYLPDSPRWLLAKGKVQQCAEILSQIAKTNGTKGISRARVEKQLRIFMWRQTLEKPFINVLAYPKLTLRTLMLFLISFTQYMVYTVAMLSMTVLSNSFVAHFVLSIFELPSNFIGWVVIHYLGRRFMAYSTLLLLTGFCFAAYFCSANEWLLLTILGFVKLYSTCGLFIVLLMTSEVLPTPVRTSGTGITIVFGMLGMVVAPHVLHSGFGEGGYYWILMAMTLASAFCMISIPETIGLQLPQTFQDAENLGRGRPFTSWIHHWNLHKFLNPMERQHKVSENL